MSRSRKIKLGWLFPYSGIFRRLKTDLEQGLALGWGDGNKEITLVPHPAFIQTGGLKETEDALKKLLLYDEVDLVIGVISTKVAYNIIPLLEKQQTPLLMLNLGADLPTSQLDSPYLFYNSLHLWKSEWAMGKWAQKKYGGEPSIGMSAYEGGYNLHEAFKVGTAASGAETVKLNMVRNFSPNPDVSPLIQYLNIQRPQYTHALLSGKEGEQFLELFYQQGLYSQMALTTNPFMVDDGLHKVIPRGTGLCNAITWSRDLASSGNQHFLESYQAHYDEYPHAFTLLAYEAGLALARMVQSITGKIKGDTLADALQQVQVSGPRGTLNFSTRPLQTNMPVYIRQLINTTGTTENKIIHLDNGIEWNDPSLTPEQSLSSGWQNPYLCV